MNAEAKWAIAETVYRYALGIDTRDWVLYRSIFEPEVRIDFSSYNGQSATIVPADTWVERLRMQFSGLAATQHSMSNPMIGFSDDSGQVASCRMYMQAHHVFDADDPASWFTIGGFYDDTLVWHDDRWLLSGVKLTVLWRRGDPSIMVAARERSAQA